VSLYASVLDLELQGAPPSALARVRTSETYQLTTASALADDYLRGRYTLPLVSAPSATYLFPATGSTATGTLSVAYTVGAPPPLQAYGIVVVILSPTTYKLSIDGGVSYGATTAISTTPIDLSFGVTLTFSSGSFYTGDQYKVSVSYGSLTAHTVAITTYRLLTTRGVAPDGNAYDVQRDQYRQALAWLKDVRDLRTDPGLFGADAGNNGSDVFIQDPEFDTSVPLEQDRRWQSVVGRGSISPSVGIAVVGGNLT
jgi:phage gp36-like protein